MKKALIYIIVTLGSLLTAVYAQDKKISQLPPLPSINGSTELIPLAKGGANYYMTPNQLKSWIGITPLDTTKFIPIVGTYSNNPLTGTIEFDNSISYNTTAIYQNINTGHGFDIGIGDNKDLGNATTGSYININPVMGITSFDTISGNQTIQIAPNNYTHRINENNNLNYFFKVDFKEGYTNNVIASDSTYQGLKYDSLTTDFINTNQTNFSILNRKINDKRYLPINGNITINGVTQTYSSNPTFTTNTVVSSTAPITVTSGTVVGLNKGYGLSVSSNTLIADSTVLASKPYVTARLGNYLPLTGGTLTGDLTLGGNITYSLTINNSLTGTNQRIPSHPSSLIRFTNSGLTSIASANNGGVTAGHTIIIENLTGNSITIVNSYSAAATNEKIFTGTGQNITLPNQSAIYLIFDNTGWDIISSGLGVNYQPTLNGIGFLYQSGSTTSYTNTIPNSSLANSTISGVSLGLNLNSLVGGYGISGSSYNGASTYTWTADSSVLASKPYVTAKLNGKQNTLSGSTSQLLSAGATTVAIGSGLSLSSGTLSSIVSTSVSATAPITVTSGTSIAMSYSAPLTVSSNSLAISTGGITNAMLSNSTFTVNGVGMSLGTSSTTISAGTGISISGSTITNTAPNQTVNLTAAGTTTISGSYPNYTINTTGVSSVSPVFSGTPTAPTPSYTNSSTQLATTKYVCARDTAWGLTGDATTTSTVAATIGNFTFTAVAGARYSVNAYLRTGCNNTGGLKVSVTIPGTSTMNIGTFGNTSSVNATTQGVLTTSASLSSYAYNTLNANGLMLQLQGTISVDNTGGTVSLSFASVTSGQTSTIYKEGSYIIIKRIL